MDILATVLGLAIGAAVVLQAASGETARLSDGGMLALVFFGGLAATMVASPWSALVNVLRAAGTVFRRRGRAPAALVHRVVGMAETARRQGILALERDLNTGDEPFLAAGIRLLADGTQPQLILDIMETELRYVQERHALNRRVMRALGRNWALMGGGGALLVAVLQAGAGGNAWIGQAALPLFYGAVLAGFLGLPFAAKLSAASQREILAKRLLLKGVVAIQTGTNARLLEHELMVCLQPKERRPVGPDQAPAPAASRPAPPQTEDRGAEEVAAWVAGAQKRMLQLMREAVESRPAEGESRAAIAAMLDKVERGELAVVRALPALDQEARREVFQALAGRSPRMAESVPVPKHGFGFEDIAQMTDREIQTLLREVDQKDLVVALQGASPGLREKVLANTSARVRKFLQEEMSFLGPIPPAAVLGVQTRVAAQVLRLWAQGQVDLPGQA